MPGSPTRRFSTSRSRTRRANSGDSPLRTRSGRRPILPSWWVGRWTMPISTGETGELRCKLSDGSLLDVKPAAREAEDDPPTWELITPGGVVLEFGPGVRWQIGSADSRASSRA